MSNYSVSILNEELDKLNRSYDQTVNIIKEIDEGVYSYNSTFFIWGNGISIEDQRLKFYIGVKKYKDEILDKINELERAIETLRARKSNFIMS